MVEGWWGFGRMGRVVFHCLEFWLVDGVFVRFLNGILMEYSTSSIEVLFGSSVRVSLACPGSGWWSGVLFVPLELRRFLVVFACGGVFHFFPVIS